MMRKDIKISHSTEKRTIDGIREVYTKYKYIIDPHTAVGYNGVLDNMDNNKFENFTKLINQNIKINNPEPIFPRILND